MASVRNGYKKQIIKDEADFAEIEKQLNELSKNLKTNKKAYLTKLNEALNFLQIATEFEIDHKPNFRAYHYDNGYFIHLKTLFGIMRTNIERSILQETQGFVSSKEKTKNTTSKEEEGTFESKSGFTGATVDTSKALGMANPTPNPNLKVVEKPKSSSVVVHFEPLVEQAQTSFKAFIEYQSYDLIKIQLAHASYQACNEARLFASKNEDFDTLESLRVLLQNNQMEWHLLLERLLDNRGLDSMEAELLIDLASQLVANNTYAKSIMNEAFVSRYVKIALESGSGKLLDFLFKHTSVPIHTLRMRGNLSLVMYCVVHDSAVSPKLACLSVLFKNGASLMELHPEKHLPIAYLLLNTPKHPLRQTLFDNTELAMANPHFMKTLLRCLEKFKSDSGVKAFIKTSEKDMQETNNGSKINVFQKRNNLLVTEKCGSVYDQETLLLLKYDRDLREASLNYENVKTEFLKIASPLERIAAKKSGTDFFEENLKSKKDQMASFAELKPALWSMYLITTEQLQKKIDLINWNKNRSKHLLPEQVMSQYKILHKRFHELSKIIESPEFRAGQIILLSTLESKTERESLSSLSSLNSTSSLPLKYMADSSTSSSADSSSLAPSPVPSPSASSSSATSTIPATLISTDPSLSTNITARVIPSVTGSVASSSGSGAEKSNALDMIDQIIIEAKAFSSSLVRLSMFPAIKAEGDRCGLATNRLEFICE
jgi:hypothetical protein